MSKKIEGTINDGAMSLILALLLVLYVYFGWQLVSSSDRQHVRPLIVVAIIGFTLFLFSNRRAIHFLFILIALFGITSAQIYYGFS